jgi:hypothetical protein
MNLTKEEAEEFLFLGRNRSFNTFIQRDQHGYQHQDKTTNMEQHSSPFFG